MWEIITSKKLMTSFNPRFSVDYYSKCNIYLYCWEEMMKRGIVSNDEQEVIAYIKNSREIIRQKHLENISN